LNIYLINIIGDIPIKVCLYHIYEHINIRTYTFECAPSLITGAGVGTDFLATATGDTFASTGA
jgi:hypothetical protein